MTAWLGTRNDAAHGDYAKVIADAVKLMIEGIRLFMSITQPDQADLMNGIDAGNSLSKSLSPPCRPPVSPPPARARPQSVSWTTA